MIKLLGACVWALLLLFALAACDGFQLPGSSGSVSPTGRSTTNTSPGTRTNGPVIIMTDHSVYQPTEWVSITVRNTLSTPIYAFDTKASCSILDLQVQSGQTW